MQDNPILRRRADHRALSISEDVCESVAHAAYELDMSGIAVFTQTGTTARLVSKYRPTAPIFAFAANTTVCRAAQSYVGRFTAFLRNDARCRRRELQS